ncbi:B-4DMT family transporter [Nocardia carnea]|uniref:B-4DMT family transporter n=1 Tax=Nocardia carnea TaxID=37328 RepID=UPI00245389C5|nr:B-4DMT family transporter [Nocardia carnea]
MTAWLLRALALGGLAVVLRVLLGFAMGFVPTYGVWLRLLCLVVLIGAAVAWGLADGRADRRANPNPERGADLTILWLQAAVAGGIGCGLVSWLLDFVPRVDLGDAGLLFEATAASAFIVLLIFVPALVGVAVGRKRARGERGGTADTTGFRPAGSAA